MTDPGSQTENATVTEGGAEAQSTKDGGLLASPAARIVLAVVAVLVVLGVVGYLLTIFVMPMLMPGLLTGIFNKIPPPVVTTTTTSSKPATTAAPIVEPAEKPLSATFTFRNVFEPTVEAVAVASTVASGSASVESSVPAGATEPDTLYLLSVQTDGGKKTATFAWNSALYTVSEGEAVDDSPWKVITIGTDSAVMLYGDSQVTLTVGQGFTK